MADVLAEIGGVKLTIRMAGIAAALLTLVLFAALRSAMNKKTTAASLKAETRKFLRFMDGIGFGLLPAIAVWKLFEAPYAGAGSEVIEPLPRLPWVMENGRFLPCGIETAAALLCFLGVCLWLMIRKEDVAETGDLLIISGCLWAGIRVVTESFREAPDNVLRYVYCGVILICLAIWTARQRKQPHAKQRIAGNWGAVIICTGMIGLTTSGTLSVGSAIGDLVVIAGCSALNVLLTLLCGGDSRQMSVQEA